MMFAEFFTLKFFVPKHLRRGVIYPIHNSQTSGKLGNVRAVKDFPEIVFFWDSLISEHNSLKEPQIVGDVKRSFSAMKRIEMD